VKQSGPVPVRWRWALLSLLTAAVLLPPPVSLRLRERSFDAYAYAAIAEDPRVFSVAPWGYRVLYPWLVHAAQAVSAQPFRLVGQAGLLLTALLLHFYLRRLGHADWAAWLAVAAFVRSPPVVLLAQAPFFAEPVALPVALGFLLAVECGAPLLVLALLATLGALSKEVVAAMLPLVYLSRVGSEGRARAALSTGLVALPALVASGLLRWWWTPQLAAPPLPSPILVVRLFLEQMALTGRETGLDLLLGGLLPLALLGALTPSAWPFLRRQGYLLALLLALPLFAWVYVPGPLTYAFFGANTRRLLVYPLPLLLALALHALHRLRPHFVASLAPRPAPLRVAGPVALAVAIAMAGPLVLDRYRRVDLSQRRDPALVLAVCRESLAVARRLEAGEEVRLRPSDQPFVEGETAPRQAGRLMWYLREGWQPDAAYAVGFARLAQRRAGLLLPVLTPRDLRLALHLEAEQTVRLAVAVNGVPLGTMLAGDRLMPLVVPAAPLFRGDNRLELEVIEGDPAAVRFRGLDLR
jgi:hypothetical protein